MRTVFSFVRNSAQVSATGHIMRMVCSKIFLFMQSVFQVREVGEKSGNFVFPQKVREKARNLDKSQRKIFWEQEIIEKVSKFH